MEMDPRLKRLFLGRSLADERNQVIFLTALVTPFAVILEPGALSVTFLLTGMLSWPRISLPLALFLSLPYFHLGLTPIILGLVSTLVIEGFRSLHSQQQRLAKTRQELLQTLVHELRNPLFAAKGTIDNLSARFKEIGTDELETQLSMASEAMQSINQEVDDLTQVLRLESGRLISRPVVTTLEQVYRMLRRRHHSESLVGRQLVLEGGDCVALCDPLLLVQALDKLITNALVHAPHGMITVMATGKGQRVILDVQDEGPGIAQEDRELVFDRFKQLGANSIGFGLGLFLARQYVLAQAGVLTLEDSPTGCLFRISLPKGE
jgi:signal transduction histidine kinase